jgi:hypothetical protein
MPGDDGSHTSNNCSIGAFRNKDVEKFENLKFRVKNS